MPRHDVYLFDGSIVLDVQSDLVSGTRTRVVVPLLPEADLPASTPRLHPTFRIGDETRVLATHLVAAVPEAGLERPIASLSARADEITRALDTLLTDW